jgi:hypothetical protein
VYFAAFAYLTWWTLGLCFYIKIKTRADAGRIVAGSENVWSFGQILAVLLIVIPLFNALEMYNGTYL